MAGDAPDASLCDAAPAGAGADAGDALPPVPREGLSLAALRAFVDEHRGHSFAVREAPRSCWVMRPFELLTTAQVVAAVILPATRGAGPGGAHCTYAELLLATVRHPVERGPPGCGTAASEH
jgi:hypothetical protein